jgi:hypothetical protein
VEVLAKGANKTETRLSDDAGEGLAALGTVLLRAGHAHEARVAFEKASTLYGALLAAGTQDTFSAADDVESGAAAAELADGDVVAAFSRAQAAVTREERRAADARTTTTRWRASRRRRSS